MHKSVLKKIYTFFILAFLLQINCLKTSFASGNIEYGVVKKSGTNVRKGPGEKYPIIWSTKKDNVPVEIYNYVDGWYNTKYWTGDSGWVKQHLIAKKRKFVIITNDDVNLYRIPFNKNEGASEVVAIFKKGFICKLLSPCSKGWCRVRADKNTTGWVNRKFIWGPSYF